MSAAGSISSPTTGRDPIQRGSAISACRSSAPQPVRPHMGVEKMTCAAIFYPVFAVGIGKKKADSGYRPFSKSLEMQMYSRELSSGEDI